MSCLSAPLTNAVFAYLCICVFVFVYLQVRHPGTLFLSSLYHHLSENIWFVWSKTSYSGDKRRCYQAGRTTTNKQWKIELLSLWAVGRLSFANIQIHKYRYTNTQIQHLRKGQKYPIYANIFEKPMIQGHQK